MREGEGMVIGKGCGERLSRGPPNGGNGDAGGDITDVSRLSCDHKPYVL